jgi:hypothetical protein
MPIIRAVPLKDATTTALTSCGVGTAYDVGGVYAGQKLYRRAHSSYGFKDQAVQDSAQESSQVMWPSLRRRASGGNGLRH